MFKVCLSPVASNKDTVIKVVGDVLTVDGVDIDFAELKEGEQCETAEPLLGLATRLGGVVSIMVRFEYDTLTAEPMQSVDIADYIVNVNSGFIPDVIKRKPTQIIHDLEQAHA